MSMDSNTANDAAAARAAITIILNGKRDMEGMAEAILENDRVQSYFEQPSPTTAFCGDCGGWEPVELRTIGPSSQQFICVTCGGALLNVRG